MSIFDRKPALRWLTPLAFVAVIGGTTGIVATATADDTLPKMSAQELLVHLQQSKVDAFSGTVVQNSDLGIPSLPGMGGSDDASLTSLVSGSHTLDVWYGGPDKARLRVQGTNDESDIIVNGTSVWNWSYKDKTASHRTLTAPADQKELKTPTDLPKTPQEAADQILKAVSPTTKVSTPGNAVVAGEKAYELVLEPQDAGSLVSQVRIAVDGTNFMPLRVEVIASDSKPAFEVGYTKVSFEQPDAAQFDFKAPPGTKVTEVAPRTRHAGAPTKKELAARKADHAAQADQTKVYGKGWSSVVVTKMPAASAGKTGAAQAPAQLSQVLNALPKVSGSWGTGRLLSGTAFSAVLTDDGRIAVGSVKPDLLYAALAR